MSVIAGTAGHIDHGKTALIKALTGTDTDRLPEEKKRGITIDLGFAELELGGQQIGFVDVPGHERFVKNMLAGASGIDLVLMIIAADEGVMPQTREHFDICRLLGIQNGLIALTKTDLVDDELTDLVRLEVAEMVEGSFLEKAAVIAVSSKSGEGIDELKNAVVQAALRVEARPDHLVTRLAIDRRFTVKGFGTVVTGTLASGTISATDDLALMPAAKKVRVRGLQTYGKEATSVNAGQRVAVNLAGVDLHEIERGMALCELGALRPVQMYDAQIEVLENAPKPLRSRQRVRVHIGTAEVLARVHIISESGEIGQGKTDLAQFRLEKPVAAIPGERFIVRSYSPQITIAGGTIIDNFPSKHRKRDTEKSRDYLHRLMSAGDNETEVVTLIVEASGENGLRLDSLQSRTGWKKEVIETALGESAAGIVDAGGVYVGSQYFDAMVKRVLHEIVAHHKREPLSDGILLQTLRDRIFAHKPAEIFRAVLERERLIVVEHDRVKSVAHSHVFTVDEGRARAALKDIFVKADLTVPKLDEVLETAIKGTKLRTADARKILQILINSGEIVKITDEFYFAAGALTGLIEKLRANPGSGRSVEVREFKQIAGVSRKYAIPLLEYFDRTKVTLRSGDRRVIL